MKNKLSFFAMLSCMLLHAGSVSAQPSDTLIDDAAFEHGIPTVYPTKDYVISDFVVTDFGAESKPGFDNRQAFQSAIDAAYEAGGGVVYIPGGNYEFLSTQKGQRQVRVREGENEILKTFEYQYVLKLHTGVQLRGDWADPAAHGNKVSGTILEVRVGKNAPGADASVKSWWNDPQAGNILRTTYTSVADRFIEMNACTGVTNLSIWYPEQDIDDVKPYPWTLFQTGGDSATIEHVTLVNSYNGFMSAPSELHYFVDSYMTALNKGIEVHVCTDIGRIENVRISPEYWAESGLPGAPSVEKTRRYTLKHGTGFEMHRSDWEYVSYLSVEGYKTGIWIGREPGFRDAPNAQLYGIDVNDCMTGLYVQEVNPYGILVSNSSFKVVPHGKAAYFYEDFKTCVQFNGVDFSGQILSEGTDGVISFENCSFGKTESSVLNICSGNVLMTQCRFSGKKNHVVLGRQVRNFKSINCGHDGKLHLKSFAKTAEVEMCSDPDFRICPIPENIQTDITIFPKPKSDLIYKADFPRAEGYDNSCPSEDVSRHIQAALDELSSRGGGTLYLPSGRYLVEHPIVVPEGVEIRGSWDVPHHTQGGGTALLTNYDGGEEGENGPSLIQLSAHAGLNGILIAQLNIANGGYDMNHPRKTPFLVQGQGKGVYVVNTTIGIGDKGVDLASYDTSGHYVNYLAGVLLRAGIWVGGGAEGGFIRNMQFNPHYSVRLPRGKQGYPSVGSMNYIQSHCSALKFADVKDETIFNNFVFGSVYGIHFLKDAVTGRYPGKMTMVGHGSDGCTYALFIEDADKDTEIIGVNSELVNTRIVVEPLRSYVLMGRRPDCGTIDPEAKLFLYNTAMWGSPVIASIVNGGQVFFNQANFQSMGECGVDVHGGKVHVYTSYFPQPLKNNKTYFRTDLGKSGIVEKVNLFHSCK